MWDIPVEWQCGEILLLHAIMYTFKWKCIKIVGHSLPKIGKHGKHGKIIKFN